MTATLHAPCTHLSDGAMLRLSDRCGDHVAVLRGRVWITQDSDPRDVVLDAGEGFDLDRPGLAIVQAFGAACVRVEVDPSAAAPAVRAEARSEPRDLALGTTRPSAIDLDMMARRMRSELVANGLRRLGDTIAGRVADLNLRMLRRKAALFTTGRVVQC